MKNVKTPEQKAQNYKETSLCLKAIESLIKTATYRSIGYKMLNNLDSDQLVPDHKVTYLYLYGRYFTYTYRITKDVEDLETANDFFDDVMQYAFGHDVKVTDFKIFYSRAYTKFQLAKIVWDEERKPWLLKKAKSITDRALSIDNSNDSFLWLQQQLQS